MNTYNIILLSEVCTQDKRLVGKVQIHLEDENHFENQNLFFEGTPKLVKRHASSQKQSSP